MGVDGHWARANWPIPGGRGGPRSLVLLLFLFTAALLGMQLFGAMFTGDVTAATAAATDSMYEGFDASQLLSSGYWAPRS